MESSRERLLSGFDSVALWAGLTVFVTGLALFLPLPSWVLVLKVSAVPFCVLLTQVLGRFAEDLVRPFLKRYSEDIADLVRTALLLLPFAVLFSIFAIREGMEPSTALTSFALRFGLCMMVVPGSLFMVQATLRLTDRPRRRNSGAKSRRRR